MNLTERELRLAGVKVLKEDEEWRTEKIDSYIADSLLEWSSGDLREALMDYIVNNEADYKSWAESRGELGDNEDETN